MAVALQVMVEGLAMAEGMLLVVSPSVSRANKMKNKIPSF